MKKFLTALFCFVAADAFAAALDENDWRFSYPSYGVVYDGGTARFVGDETSHSALYFDSGKVGRLGGGFSAEFELPSLFADGGSSFGATLRGADGGEWVSWSVEFYADNVSVSISSSGAGSPIERDFPVLSPVEQSFGLSFSLEKSADGFYRATLSTLDETFELGSISLVDFANGEFFISAIGQNFEMDKDNPLLVDFSYASSILEPAAFAFAFGICVLSAAVLKRRG